MCMLKTFPFGLPLMQCIFMKSFSGRTGNESELRTCKFEIYKLVHCCEHYLNN